MLFGDWIFDSPSGITGTEARMRPNTRLRQIELALVAAIVVVVDTTVVGIGIYS